MRKRYEMGAGAAVALLLLAGSPAAAQSAERNRMGVPPTTIFKSMLRFASEGEPAKIERSVTLLKPVIEEHNAAFGPRAVDALVQRVLSADAKTSGQAIRTLIARDVVIMLRAIADLPNPRARTVARSAALEWRIVDENLAIAKAPDADDAQTISERFQELVSAVEAQDAESVGVLVTRLERDVLKLFP